jgi:hypothetical protein
MSMLLGNDSTLIYQIYQFENKIYQSRRVSKSQPHRLPRGQSSEPRQDRLEITPLQEAA